MTLTRRVMAEKRRYIYPLIAAVVLNAGLLIGVVAPLSKKVASGEQQAQEARTVLAVAKKDHAAARATVSGKDAADGELKKFYSSVLPPDSSAARRLTNTKVDEIARAAGVTRTGSTTKPSHDRDSELGKLTVTALDQRAVPRHSQVSVSARNDTGLSDRRERAAYADDR